MEAPDAGTAPSASDASQSAASSAESTPSPETTSAPDTSAAGDTAADSAALADAFGVMDDGAPPPGPTRDEKGRFAPRGDAPPQPAPDAPTAVAAPAPEKFKLADLEFDSPDHAAQQIKTLRGMFKPMEREVRDLRSELTNAINVANAWKAQAEGKSATAAPPATAPAGAPASTAPAVPAEPKWDVIQYLAQHPETGVAGALVEYHQQAQALAEAREQALRAEIKREIEAQYSPVLQSHAEQAELAEVGALVDQMASWTIQATGAPAFPELSDINQVAAIGQTWRDAGNDPALLKTPQGLQMAVALHRMWNGFTPAAPVVAAAPSTQAPPPPAAPAPPGSSDLALAMGGTAPPNVRPGGPVSPQAATRAAIRGADPVDAFWGVTP